MENKKRPEKMIDMIREVTAMLYDSTKELAAMPSKTADVHEQIRKNGETLVRLYHEFW